MVDATAESAPAARDALPVEALAAALADALTGPAHAGASAVIWSDRGSELIVHAGKLQVRALDNALVVAVDTESVEFGGASLIVRFVFGDAKDPASLVAATDASALGHPGLAARWGGLFRDVVWAALVRLSVSHASSRGLVPASLTVERDRLLFVAEPMVSVPDLAATHVRHRRAAQADHRNRGPQ